MSAQQRALWRILAEQVRRYPCMQVEDVYKLIYQASMGSEHAAPDRALARARLEQELACLGDGPEEPLLDEISPAGKVVRVHLRPYSRAGYDPERLLEALLRTAREFRGSTERLRTYAEATQEMARAGQLPFQADQVSAFMAEMQRQGFPAVHHSGLYRTLYRPAYRVVARAAIGWEPAWGENPHPGSATRPGYGPTGGEYRVKTFSERRFVQAGYDQGARSGRRHDENRGWTKCTRL